MAAVSRSVFQGLLRTVGRSYSESSNCCTFIWNNASARLRHRCLPHQSRRFSDANAPKDGKDAEDTLSDPDLAKKQRPLAPKIDLTMTQDDVLKVSVENYSAQPGDPRTVNDPVTVYSRVDFSSLESQLPSYKVTPFFIKWLPQSLRSKFFNSVLSAALKKGFLHDDFDSEEYYHFGGLASMKLADMVSSGDLKGLQDLISESTTLLSAAIQRPELEKKFDDISSSSADDLLWSGLSKVFIQDQSPGEGISGFIVCQGSPKFVSLKDLSPFPPGSLFFLPSSSVHITLHTLCRFNAQLKDPTLPGQNTEVKVFNLLLKRIACTFQQHYSLDTSDHSEWRASELVQNIDIVPIVLPELPGPSN